MNNLNIRDIGYLIPGLPNTHAIIGIFRAKENIAVEQSNFLDDIASNQLARTDDIKRIHDVLAWRLIKDVLATEKIKKFLPHPGKSLKTDLDFAVGRAQTWCRKPYVRVSVHVSNKSLDGT